MSDYYNYKAHRASFSIQKYDKGFMRWTWVPLKDGTELECIEGGSVHGNTFTRWGAFRKAKRWLRYDENCAETYYDSNGNLL